MAVRPDNTIARGDQPLLRQKRVFDAHLPNFEIVRNILRARKLAHFQGLLGSLDILVRGKMVRHEGYFFRVKYARAAQLFELANRRRRGDIIAQHEVELGLDELACFDSLEPCLRGENLLGHCHCFLGVCCVIHRLPSPIPLC